MWLSFSDEDIEFHLEGCSFWVSSGDGWLWISFFSCILVKESVLGGDNFFGGCYPMGVKVGFG